MAAEEYGLRGVAQTYLDRVTYGLVEAFTGVDEPPALAESIGNASGARTPLVVGAEEPDEDHLARRLAAAAPCRVAVWSVPGATQASGFEADPVAWIDEVTTFLADALDASAPTGCG